MKEMTRKCDVEMMENVYARYKASDVYELHQAYGNYSIYKARAMERCRNLMNSLDGWGLKIIGWNSTQFSVGFEYPNADTGEIMFGYITRDYDRCCPTSF